MLGVVGQLLLIAALVACGISGVAHFMAARDELRAASWIPIARGGWAVMAGSVIGAALILWFLIFSHRFEYHYVWRNTSRDLPLHFLFSSFWAGQEGSFLLWIVLNAALGLFVGRLAREFEAPVMTVIAFCQFFLIAMIVGLQIGPLAIGASPFKLLVEQFPDAPMLQIEGYVPPDGNGLNDLLQNYWMAIHPPTLFTGFTAMIVPFAFAVAALWTKRYTSWVRPALPWTLGALLVLGIGIAMGGYWAYETLSFGGYWAWDPVENSSLVPWIVGVAGLHMMIVQKKSGSAHKAALFLAILAYILIVYSTFLTRSGILGDVSVHSFVDLGLYNQLLLWILAMAVVGFGLFVYRYRELPAPAREPAPLSRESMIFAGALLLCAVAAVVILGTSAPILGRLFRDNPAAVPIDFYNAWTVPLAIGILLLAGLGQLLWWHNMNVEHVNKMLLRPLALSVACTVAVLIFTPFIERTVRAGVPQEASMAEAGILAAGSFWSVYGEGILLLALVFTAFFAFFGNSRVLWRIGRGNVRLAGGSFTHIGFAVMVLGVIASSAFSNTLSDPGRENFVVARGETHTVDGYQVRYVDREETPRGHTRYVLDIVDSKGRSYTVQPVAYQSKSEQWIQHPDVKLYAEQDLFVAVSPSAMFETGEEGGNALTLARGAATPIGGDAYSVVFNGFDINVSSDLVPDSTEIAVAAVLEITNRETGDVRELRPIYLVMPDGSQQYIQNRVADWDLTVTFVGMNVDTGEANIMVEGADVATEDWVVVQAYEKPLISLVWIGIILLSIGMGLSMYRRASEYRFVLARGRA